MSKWYLDDPDHEPTNNQRRRSEEKAKRKDELLEKGWERLDLNGEEWWRSPRGHRIKYKYIDAKNIEELRISLNLRKYI